MRIGLDDSEMAFHDLLYGGCSNFVTRLHFLSGEVGGFEIRLMRSSALETAFLLPPCIGLKIDQEGKNKTRLSPRVFAYVGGRK